jgi:transcriptional regulator with XRE-family HTH domain
MDYNIISSNNNHYTKQRGEVHDMDERLLLNRIYAIRMENDITLQRLSDLSGISIGAISDIESGREMPTHWTMLKICGGLGMLLEEVFENDYKNVNIM